MAATYGIRRRIERLEKLVKDRAEAGADEGGEDLAPDVALFELHGPEGQVWKLFANGTYSGFPDGTFVVNNAHPTINLLRARIEKLQAALIPDQQ